MLAGMKFGIPVSGTMAHSFVMTYEKEKDAFREFSKVFPNTILLIDTYDTVQGAKNAIAIERELEAKGLNLRGVRLDSGNLLSLCKKVRALLDAEGMRHLQIFASGDLDEYKIDALMRKRAPIDAFGVGTAMDTSRDAPVVNVNYKIIEYSDEKGKMRPCLKLSTGKQTYPGAKQVYRHYRNGKMLYDIIALRTERFGGEPLLREVMREGKLVAKLPGLEEIRVYAKESLAKLPEKYKRLRNPQKYDVHVSQEIMKLTSTLAKEAIS